MKQTEKWLPIAQKKAQSELTTSRGLIRAIDKFRIFDNSSNLLAERKRLSSEIRAIRYYLKNERFKAILRGDLPVDQYRPGPPKTEKLQPILSLNPLQPVEIEITPAEQRELLLAI